MHAEVLDQEARASVLGEPGFILLLGSLADLEYECFEGQVPQAVVGNDDQRVHIGQQPPRRLDQ